MNLTEKDFLRLAQFIHSNYGIQLFKKKTLIEGRLSTSISQLGFTDFSSYVDFIMNKGTADDINFMLNKLTTNYTFFMREELHFDYLKNTILPQLMNSKPNKVLSIWSAGCSTGQEPYTISIILKEFLGDRFSQWDTRVLATDISQNVLTQAKQGIYSRESIEALPESWRKKYFNKSKTGTDYEVCQELKDNVIFKTFNLMDPIQFKTKFDVIFCRNVMIYFDHVTKDALVERFYNATNPNGYLLIGHAETVDKNTSSYHYLMPAVYRK